MNKSSINTYFSTYMTLINENDDEIFVNILIAIELE